MNNKFIALVFSIALLTVSGLTAAEGSINTKSIDLTEVELSVQVNPDGSTIEDKKRSEQHLTSINGVVTGTKASHLDHTEVYPAPASEAAVVTESKPGMVSRAAASVKGAADTAATTLKVAAHTATGAVKGATRSLTTGVNTVGSSVKDYTWNSWNGKAKWVTGTVLGAATLGLLYKFYEKYFAAQEDEQEEVTVIIYDDYNTTK